MPEGEYTMYVRYSVKKPLDNALRLLYTLTGSAHVCNPADQKKLAYPIILY